MWKRLMERTRRVKYLKDRNKTRISTQNKMFWGWANISCGSS